MSQSINELNTLSSTQDYAQAFFDLHQQAKDKNTELSLNQFLADFGESLFKAVTEQNQPIYQGQTYSNVETTLNQLDRQLFPAQREVVRAVNQLLMQENLPAAIINAEMGTGKTMMAIASAAACHAQGLQRALVLSPPHLVYKWRREILKTIPNARVWILNGTDTLNKLLKIRLMAKIECDVPEFFILGRVRMRMGYHWRPAYNTRYENHRKVFCCPCCGGEILNDVTNEPFADSFALEAFLKKERRFCQSHSKKSKNRNTISKCKEPLWTLCHKDQADKEQTSVYDRVIKAISSLPTLGKKSAEKLISIYGEDYLASILENNVQAFSNLLDENGEFIFSDRQATRLDRALSKSEFSLGQGGYQPTEFIKRYLPKNFFGLMIIDEGHEYKNYGTAQGQAMGVLARCCKKVLCLTGTLMGGYAEDLFYLLWRLFPQAMIEDGFCYNKSNTLGRASMAFMRQHGVLKDIVRSKGSEGIEYSDGSFTSSKATRNQVRTVKAPGFSPLGIMRYVLPITVFLKLRDLGQNVLPDYQEIFRPIEMGEEQRAVYEEMERVLRGYLKQAMRKGDHSLTGTVMNALLAYPDCCYKSENIEWKREKMTLFETYSIYADNEPSPKERDMIEVVQDNLARGRKCLVYTIYSDTRDTTARLKFLLQQENIKAAVMKSSVKADEREDWVNDQLDAGADVIICNPELVKTGLDLLQFPTIYFMQTGYNVYTLMQAARRSWRIGQRENVEVYFAGYQDSAQQICLELMGKKINVTQSTSGDMPDSGLDILNQSEDSIEVELAKRLIEKQTH